MPDDVITQMVNDPDFIKAKPATQRAALAAHDPIFKTASDDAISGFIQAHQGSKTIPVKENEDHPFPGLTPAPPYDEKNYRFLPMVGGAIGGGAGGIPGAMVGGAAGEAIKELIHTGATGQANEEPVMNMTGAAAGQGILQLGGEAIGATAGKLAPLASQALARILRISPKAYQFGREPAEEVLRQGIEGGNLKTLVENIGQASKETTSQLNTVLKNSGGTVNIENAALDVAGTLPGQAGSRFLKVVDEAAAKLGLRSNQMTSLTNAEANALKQEVSRQAKFVEGDLRPSVANAEKIFGGKIKDGIVFNVPKAEGLLQSSANFTEASKAGDYAVRAEKAGQGKGALSAVDIKSPSTYPRVLTDTVLGAKTLFRFANALKDSGVPISQVLRIAFSMVYPQSEEK